MFLIGITSSLLIVCNNQESIDSEKVYPETQVIEAVKYNSFVSSFNQFYSNLNEKDKTVIQEFIDQKESDSKNSANGRTNVATCNCEGGQSSCSASTWFSECCICCSAPQVTVCGTYGIIASCQCKAKPGSVSKSQNAIETSPKPVTIYPTRFNELFVYLKSKSINVKVITVEFDKLVFE